MYLQDRIGENYKCWKGGESVFIQSQTGTGKTTFVMKKLVPWAMAKGKEVLFLSNRFLLKEQIKIKAAQNQGLPLEDSGLLEDAEEFEGITVMTYQKLQKICQHSGEIDYAEKVKKRYFFVVYDEAHYILQDATFNPEIFYLLLFIKAYNGTSIFLSATMDELPDFIMDWKYADMINWQNCPSDKYLRLYEIRKYTTSIVGTKYCVWVYNYPEEIRKIDVKIFKDFEELAPFINKEDDEKWLIFWGNKLKMVEYKKIVKVPCDLLSADNSKAKETQELIDEIRFKECFPKKVLMTTKILDNGINIKDQKVKNVVINTECKTEFLQMLGRKRIQDENDTVRLFIPQKKASYFSGLLKLRVEPSLNFLNKKLSTTELLRLLHDKNALPDILHFYTEYKRELVCNPAGKFKLEKDKRFLEEMLEKQC